MNGATTGMEITAAVLLPTLADHHRDRPALPVAAAGATMPGIAGCRFGTTSTRTSATPTWAFGLFPSGSSGLSCPSFKHSELAKSEGGTTEQKANE